MALSRRHAQEKISEPAYEFEDVPKCSKDLLDSKVFRVDTRRVWMGLLPELLLLCNEAQTRFEGFCRDKISELGADNVPAELSRDHGGKALSLEYITDRLDLDDPLKGFVVRTKKENWMQGFITVSTFTSWQRWFRWDSLADEAGLLIWKCEGAGLDSMHAMGIHHDNTNMDSLEMRWWKNRKIDLSGSLSAMLNAEIRDGDPETEGVIWPHIAEVSLLGGLGCGSFLLNLMIEELESESSPYDFLVLQATENSVPFYEKHGFVRVGAVARYFHRPEESDGKDRSKAARRRSIDSSRQRPIEKRTAEISTDGEKSLEESTWSEGDDAPEYFTAELEARKQSLSPSSVPFEPSNREKLQLDDDSRFQSTNKNRNGFVNHSITELTARTKQENNSSRPFAENGVDSIEKQLNNDVLKIKNGKNLTSNAMKAPPYISGSSSNFRWHRVVSAETPKMKDVAAKFGILLEDVIFMNKRLYPGKLTEHSILQDGMPLRIPIFPSYFDPLTHQARFEIPPCSLASETEGLTLNDAKQGEVSSNGLWYSSLDNDTPRQIAARLGIDCNDLIQENRTMYPDLSMISPLMENTILRLPVRVKPKVGLSSIPQIWDELQKGQSNWGWGSDDTNQDGLSGVMTYRHWAFSDDPIDYAVASYMMVRPLRKRRSGKDFNEENHIPQASLSGERAIHTSTNISDMKPTFVYGASVADLNLDMIKPPAQDQKIDAVESREKSRRRSVNAVENEVVRTVKVSLKCPSLQSLARYPKSMRQGPLRAAARFKSPTPPRDNIEPIAQKASESGGRRNVPRRRCQGVAQQTEHVLMIDDTPASENSKRKRSTIVACDLATPNHLNVFVRRSPYVGEAMKAVISRPLKYKEPQLPKPVKPRKPYTAYTYFAMERRAELRALLPEYDFSEVNTRLGVEWRKISETKRRRYSELSERDKIRYQEEIRDYERLVAQYNETMDYCRKHALESQGMVNQVVRLSAKKIKGYRQEFLKHRDRFEDSHSELVTHCRSRNRLTDIEDHDYFYVLTYIPDLFWCRLAPMHQAGVFSDPRKPQHFGQPKWTLIPEGAATEVDVSASRCTVVMSQAVNNSQDADHEEWYIYEARTDSK